MSEWVATEQELREVQNACAHFADLAAAGAALSLWLVLWEHHGQEWLKTKEGVEKAYQQVTGLKWELAGSQGFFSNPIEQGPNPPMIDGIRRLREIADECKDLLKKPKATIEATKRLFEEQDAGKPD